MKTERITLLASAAFKSQLATQARKAGVSMSEYVRQRCQANGTGERDAEEREVLALAARLRKQTQAARQVLRDGLQEADAVLAALERQRRQLKKAA